MIFLTVLALYALTGLGVAAVCVIGDETPLLAALLIGVFWLPFCIRVYIGEALD